MGGGLGWLGWLQVRLKQWQWQWQWLLLLLLLLHCWQERGCHWRSLQLQWAREHQGERPGTPCVLQGGAAGVARGGAQ